MCCIFPKWLRNGCGILPSCSNIELVMGQYCTLCASAYACSGSPLLLFWLPRWAFDAVLLPCGVPDAVLLPSWVIMAPGYPSGFFAGFLISSRQGSSPTLVEPSFFLSVLVAPLRFRRLLWRSAGFLPTFWRHPGLLEAILYRFRSLEGNGGPRLAAKAWGGLVGLATQGKPLNPF